MKEIDTLKKFGNEFQFKTISCLVSDKKFLERIYDILNNQYWDSDINRWIIDEILNYFIKYKDLPTPLTFKIKLNEMNDENFKKLVIDQLKNVYSHINDPDIKFVKEQFLEFCVNQKMKNAILTSVDYLKLGEYDEIKKLIDDARKAGMERNLGHDYIIDIDKRMSEMCRNYIKTGWNLIDEILDGGLAKGELGFIIGNAGSGKCVGPNTEIEIQYTETGIPIVGNSGKEYIIWINPFEKYDFDNDLGILYGWQISQLLEPENI